MKDDDRIAVDAIEIKERASGQRIQVLYDIEAGYRGKCDDAVGLVDANFDGYPDIVVRIQDGGAGPNFTNDYFLFNPARGRFELQEALSELVQPEIDPAKREVPSGWRNGAAEHGRARYRFAGGRLILLESEVEKCFVDLDDPDLCDVTTRRLLRGAYVETQGKRRGPF